MLNSHGEDVLLHWRYIKIIWARRSVMVTVYSSDAKSQH